ncbi:MAG: response regulator [Candidatus Acetothermia bacterium]|jgi:two-component system alkaline phosphatase synthesis response regulator PhoP|nr:response regulator [Candidatus Acetothermia bacterium]MDH7505398.1 response regulator [Candidatus Acetothermia bacterium]
MKGERILVVDDEPDMVEMLKLILESASYEVIAAYDGQEGVEKAKADRPDAIILDLMMPRKDGFQACKELKGDPATAEIPVLVLTAISEKLSHTKYAKSMGLELEAEDYIDKPVDANILLARLAKLLRRRS